MIAAAAAPATTRPPGGRPNHCWTPAHDGTVPMTKYHSAGTASTAAAAAASHLARRGRTAARPRGSDNRSAVVRTAFHKAAVAGSPGAARLCNADVRRSRR